MMQFIVAIATGENGKTVTDGIIAVVVFIIYNYFTGRIFYYCKEQFKSHIVEDIRNDIFSHIMGRNFLRYYESNTGEYLSVLNNDVKVLEDSAIQPTFTMIQYGGMLIMASIYVWSVDWGIALLMLGVAVASFFLPKLFSRNLDRKNEAFLEETAGYNEKIKDAFTGFEVITNFGILEMFKSMHQEWNHRVQEKKYHSAFALDNAKSAGREPGAV
ncbi:MAG: ABC transporter ATP-binding protein [Lachnospiraceae bacterium]|nr:ABC transporter ATP-binding protein [Lachnospiraceae bacterium]